MSAASLDDIDSEASYDSEEEYRLAQQEWEESMKQLQQLVSLVALPMFGKFLGRQWSYWRAFGIPLAVLLSSLVTFADVHHFPPLQSTPDIQSLDWEKHFCSARRRQVLSSLMLPNLSNEFL